MIELTKEQLALIIIDLQIYTRDNQVTTKTHELLNFLYNAYADNKRIITIGIKD
jgi:hypothetical protein